MGRKSDYTPEIAEKICRRLAEGESLRQICLDKAMPPMSTVLNWVNDDRGGIAAQYTRARDMGLDRMADEVIAIADSSTSETFQTSRLQFDARRWYLSKLAPKRYGDKIQHGGDSEGVPIAIAHRIEHYIVDPEKPDAENPDGEGVPAITEAEPI